MEQAKKERKRIGKMNEIAWVLGIVLCALGVALCTKADFGLSMIAAPAYIIHVGMSRFFSWYTQGTSEYIFQGILLLGLCLTIRKFKVKYLLSFVTAVLFGLALDGWFWVLGGNGAYSVLPLRIVAFALGTLSTGLAIAFFFRTRLPLQIYELVVTELALTFHWKNGRVKQIYDACSFLVSLLLALLIHHNLTGIGVGTLIVTVINAPLISLFGKLLDRIFTFESLFGQFENKKISDGQH